MAASGAMWQKTASASTGYIVVTQKMQQALAKAHGYESAEAVKAAIKQGHVGVADLMALQAKPQHFDIHAGAGGSPVHPGTDQNGNTNYTQGGLTAQMDPDGEWFVYHTSSGAALDGAPLHSEDAALAVMDKLDQEANWQFDTLDQLSPDDKEHLAAKTAQVFKQAHQSEEAHLQAVAKAQAQAAADGVTLHTMTLKKDTGEEVEYTGESVGGMFIHPALNQPGKWEITQTATGKHVAHAVDKDTALKVMKTLAEDPEVGPGLKSGDATVLQAANQAAHAIKHNEYTKPVPPPPPIEVKAPDWAEPHKVFHSGSEADSYLKEEFKAQYAAMTPITAAEQSALHSYQGSGYHSINGANWSGNPHSSAKQLDSLIAKVGGAPANMVMVRSEGSSHPLYSQAASLNVGDHYVSLGFDSAYSAGGSDWSWGASGPTSGVRVYYRVPKGTPLVHLNSLPGYHSSIPGEHEVVFGRNLCWEVVGKKVSPKASGSHPKVEITVQYVGQLTHSEAKGLYNASVGKAA